MSNLYVYQFCSRNKDNKDVLNFKKRIKTFLEYKENEDVFVHYSAIELEGYKTLSEGQLVEFKLVETSKGYQALNVQLVKETATVK